ncbi:hypothetical protein PAXRUDRAFT_572119 [Paxillus rubicundulus Ve08.2h10]|uniref:Uncharacterized protein n=1 Tax=Paxillus rubicundulus Ve08.2h10 TaxID=930991 RepID=A0A0D0DLZ5_9AGAM|nr:hypothetical protein PAXRUDRAFT_572119 [Paxillus rubicundulus Ve08.2h10]
MIDGEIGAWLLDCQVWLTFVALWAIQGIMQVRVYAMWNQSRNVLLFMVLCFFIELVSTSISLGYRMNDATSTSNAVDHTCSPNIEETNFVILFLPTLVFEFILLLLVLRPVQRHVLASHEITKEWQVTPLVKILAIYSVVYFFASAFPPDRRTEECC